VAGSGSARPWLPAGLSVAAAGLSLGVWLWLLGLPTARVLLPDGEVGYLHGPAALPLPLAVVLGLGGLGLLWLALGALLSRLRGMGLGDALRGSATAYLPLLLILVDATRLLLPLGWLTNPAVVLTYEGRWVVAGAVALTVMVLHLRLLAPAWREFRIGPRGLAVGTFLLVLAVYLAFLPRAVLVGPTGDEPDYLLLAHSLVVDQDFDLQNNVEGRDYLRFVPRLQPHVQPGAHGGLYSFHRLGLPLLIAPAYGVGLAMDWPVRVPVAAFLCLLAALLTARTASLALHLTGHGPSALLTGLAVAFSAPWFFYAYAIFPEMPAALLLMEILRRLVLAEGRRAWGVGLLLALLPWFQERFFLPALILAGWGVWVYGRRRELLWQLFAPLAISGALFMVYANLLYGRPLPYHRHGGFSSLASIHFGLLGPWLDRDHGLLVLAPIFLLVVPGIVPFLREHRRPAVMALSVFLGLYGVIAAYSEWWGGFAPPPRYLMPVLPVLALALAFGIRETLARGRVVRVLLLAGASALVATYAVIYPALQYRHAHPLRSLFAGLDWTRYLPSWTFPDERTWPLAGLAIAVAGLWVLGRLGRPVLTAPGLRLTVAGCLSLLVVAGVVLAGDLLSGARRPYLPQEEANRELRAFLLRLDAGPPGPGRLSLRAPGPIPSQPLRLVYEAERLPGEAPQRVEDPLALNGLAREGGRAGGYLVFGPYETLPRGSYRVEFRLRPGPALPRGAVGTLEVTAAKGQERLAAREVRPDDLSPDGYREIGLSFELPIRTENLEWRVRLEHPGTLRVDRIAIIPEGFLPAP